MEKTRIDLSQKNEISYEDLEHLTDNLYEDICSICNLDLHDTDFVKTGLIKLFCSYANNIPGLNPTFTLFCQKVGLL